MAIGRAGGIGISWETLLFAVFQYKWRALGIFALVSALVGVVTFLRPAVYRSEARFLLRLGRESIVLDPTAIPEEGRTAQTSLAREVYTALEIFRSQDVAAKAIDQLGEQAILEPIEYALARASAEGIDASIGSSWKWKARIAAAWRAARAVLGGDDSRAGYDRQKATAALMRNLHVRDIPSTNVISVIVESYHPLTAQVVLKALTHVYLKEHQSAYRNPSTMQFFSDQARQWEDELRRTEDMLVGIHNESQTTSLQDSLEEVSRSLAEVDARIGELEAERSAVKAVQAGLMKRLRTSDRALAERRKAGLHLPSTTQLQLRLNALWEEEQALWSRYYDDSPPLKKIREDIARIQELLGSGNGSHESILIQDPEIRRRLEIDLFQQERMLASTDARLAVLREQRAHMLDRVRDMNEVAAKVHRLERLRERQEVNLGDYSNKYEQTRTDAALEREKISNILRIQTATYPANPSRPRKKVMIAGGALLGALCGLGYVVLVAFLDKRLKLPVEVEDGLGLPVLASIPQIPRQSAVPWVSGSGATFIPPSAEPQYEALCASLLWAAGTCPRPLKAIALASTGGWEGTSTIVGNLGLKLSQMCDGKVLLVDANWVRPVLHERFRQQSSPGLTDLFSKEVEPMETIRELAAPDLNLLPIGGNPQALDGERGVRLLVKLNEYWLSRFRFILYDLPAFRAWWLGVRVAASVDTCLLVIEAGRVVSKRALRLKECLLRSGVNIAGVVLNRQRTPIPSRIYQYI
jgi:uncharacterized protein involved in exopolysaccharide biosynthesis